MLRLLYKEIVLTSSPLTYFFLLFSLITLIPGYPILVSGFFICLGIFYSFQTGREYSDIFYTALLPVRKADVVHAKYAFTVAIQLLSLLLSSLLVVLRMTVLRDAAPYTANSLMNANPAYLGYLLLIFALFNMIFLPGFFKTAYYIGRPFILFLIAAFFTVGIGETLHHLPSLNGLNDTQFRIVQIPVFLLGLLIYLVGTPLSCKCAEKRFDRIDL